MTRRGQHNDNTGRMLVETTPLRLRAWKRKARVSGMTLKAWVEKALDDAPIYQTTVVAVSK